MSKCKSTFIPVNPWLIQIPETAFNEKNRLIRGEIDENFDYFMQNKPNFQKTKMNVILCLTNDYGKNCFFALPKKQSQSNPIFQ